MANIDVLDAAGVTRTVTYPDAGRSAAAASSPVVLATEDKAALDAVGTKLDTLQASVNGTDPQLPATLGPKTSANSLSMTLASDQALPLPAGAATQATLANIDADVGIVSDAAASSDTGSFSLIALIKRGLQNWTTLLGRTPALGQAAMAASSPVVLASNQSDVPARLNAYNYPVSTANSSTAQLAAGASFTGGIESAQDQPSLSILLTSDQPMTVTVRQFIDLAGTFAAPDIVFYVRAGTGFARSLTINGNYVRVIAQNTGASTTTTFNLNCAFGALGDADSAGTMPVAELPLVLTGASAQTATVNNILEPTAGANGTIVSGYRGASIQVVSTGTGGTFIFEQSNDGTNWVALPVFNAALVTGVPITAAITATASQIIYTFPIRGNFLRLRIATTITGGSIQAFTRLSSDAWTPAVNLVASNTAANLNATVSGTVTANIGTGAIAAGTNAIGDVGVQYRANATGAASITNFVAAASTNATSVKASAGRLLGYHLTNNATAVRYVKLHNIATAPTAGSGVVGTIGIPPNGGTVSMQLPGGLAFSTGIGITCVTGAAAADATAVAANDVVGYLAFA